MVEITMRVTDSLAQKLQPIDRWLPTVLELSLVRFKTSAVQTASEIIDFLANGPSPTEVLTYHVSDRAQARLQRLLAINNAGLASTDEQSELDEIERIEHIIVLLKAQAQEVLTNAPMPDAISASLRRLVTERAENRCEYCLLPQLVRTFQLECPLLTSNFSVLTIKYPLLP